MNKTTEIVLAQELFEQGLSKSAIAQRLGRDRETIRLWLRVEHGAAFLHRCMRRRFNRFVEVVQTDEAIPMLEIEPLKNQMTISLILNELGTSARGSRTVKPLRNMRMGNKSVRK